MSRIAPDIPELQQVPEALRSIAYMRALNRAIRSPLTWLLGVALFAVGIGAGAIQGRAVYGTIGALVGIAAGAAVAALLFFKLVLPWRARRILPSVTDEGELKALDHVRQADESLKRMAAAIEGQDGSASAGAPQRPRRNPRRIEKAPRQKRG